MIASLENCKRLYELSGWNDSLLKGTGDYMASAAQANQEIPAYTAGYLLRKLPQKIYGNHSYHLQLFPLEQFWVAQYYDAAGGSHIQPGQQKFGKFFAHCEDLNPENALALLAIKLFETGVLKK